MGKKILEIDAVEFLEVELAARQGFESKYLATPKQLKKRLRETQMARNEFQAVTSACMPPQCLVPFAYRKHVRDAQEESLRQLKTLKNRDIRLTRWAAVCVFRALFPEEYPAASLNLNPNATPSATAAGTQLAGTGSGEGQEQNPRGMNYCDTCWKVFRLSQLNASLPEGVAPLDAFPSGWWHCPSCVPLNVTAAVDEEELFEFCFPPLVDHPKSTALLEILVQYGPLVDGRLRGAEESNHVRSHKHSHR
jgi:hypothetical protein